MKLLFVNGCISQRGEESRTLVLARSFLDAWQARHPEAEVETVEPEALLALKPFAPEMLNDRDALAGIRCFDAPVYDLARQFRAADRVVVAAPFWDLTFPAALRTYIEYISRQSAQFITTRPDGRDGDCCEVGLISPPVGIWSVRESGVSCTEAAGAITASRRSAVCLPANWTWIPPRRRRF